MRFNTRDKKPKVWNLAALAAATATLVAMLTITGAEKHAIAISVILDIFFPCSDCFTDAGVFCAAPV